MRKKLYRSQNDKMLGGVCGGIAEYFGIDPTIIRLVFVLIFFAEGAGFLAYLVGWIIIPEKNDNNIEEREEDMKKKEKDKQVEKGKNNDVNENTDISQNQDEIVKENSNNIKIKPGSQNMWGILLIIFGGIFLVNTWFPFVFLEKMWPLLIIFIGILLLFKKSD